MEPFLYKATHGARVDYDSQSTMAHNLANVNTPGFKSDIFQAERYMTNYKGAKQNMGRDNHGINYSPGPMVTTGRDLDLAIQGEGWFAVQDGQGKESYTRAGDFKINAEGQLITASNQLVLGDGGPISIPPADRVEVGVDGTISIVPLGGSSKDLAILDRIKLVKLDGKNLSKNAEGLLQLNPGSTATPDATIIVTSGALEGSNVNAVEQMVKMITAGREFEGHLKIMHTFEENGQKLAQLLQD